MDLSELAHVPAVTCTADTAVAQVARQMRDAGAGSVVITDEHDRLRGIVTDRDLVVRGVAHEMTGDVAVGDLMTADPVHVYEHEDVFTAATRMAQQSCRRLPVLSADGRVTGVVALDDLLRTFAREVDKLARTVGQHDVPADDDAARATARGR